jgi:phosphoglycolate phosphatase
LVDVIIGGEDVTHPKPHPESIDTAIKLLRQEPQKCLYIGDSLIDAEAAFNSKVDFIAVTTGTTPKEAFSKFPNIKILSCISELLDF